MNFKKDFGNRLKEIRKQKKLTQYQLAELCNIDEKHLSHIECGGSFPKADLIEKLVKVLEIETSELFRFAHQKPKKELISEITKKLQVSSEKEVQYFHKMIFEY